MKAAKSLAHRRVGSHRRRRRRFSSFVRGNKKPVTKYETVKVDRGRITARVTATGTVSALVTVLVGSQVSGRIAELGADFNSAVKKGAGHRAHRPGALQGGRRAGPGELRGGQGEPREVPGASGGGRRGSTTAPRPSPSASSSRPADRDTAESTAAAAKAAGRRVAGRGRGRRPPVVAPGAGQPRIHDHQVADRRRRDISRSVDVGQTVAGVPASSHAVHDRPKIWRRCRSIPAWPRRTSESSAPTCRRTFVVDAYPQEKFRGKVRQNPQRRRRTCRNVVDVRRPSSDVENPDLKLKPGMTANVTFVFARAKRRAPAVPKRRAAPFRAPAELSRTAASASASPGPSASGGEAIVAADRPRRQGGAEPRRTA